MDIKEARCPNCGAALKANPHKYNVVCLYCGSRFFKEERVINSDKKEDEPKSVTIFCRDRKAPPPRPKIRGCLLIFLFVLNFWPGLVYIIIMKNKMKEWDNKYGFVNK